MNRRHVDAPSRGPRARTSHAAIGLLLAAFVLFGGLAPVGPLSVEAQTPRPADLAVQSVVVLPPGPQWIFDEARPATVRARVTNVGDTAAAYQLVFQWRNSALTRFLNEDEIHSTDTSDQGPLLRGEHRDHDITWRPQPDEIGPGEIVATVAAPGGGVPDTNRLNDKAVTDGTVPRWAARLEVDGDPPVLHRGETGFMDVRVVNEGTMPFSTSFLVMDAQEGNRSKLITSVEPSSTMVAPSTTARSTLFVTVPADARDEAVFSTNFSLRAVTSFSRNLTVATPNVTTAPGAAPTNQSFFVHEPPASRLFVPPMGEIMVPVAVSNTGEQDDTYRVELQPQGGWSATASTLHFGLHRAQTTTIDLTLGSGSLEPGTNGNIGVTVRSEHGQVAWSRELLVRASGGALTWGSVTPVPQAWYVGEPGKIEVEVRNDGDAAPSTDGFVHIDLVPPDGPVTRIASLRARPDAFSSVKVQTAVPAPVEGGTHAIQVGWTGPSDASSPAPFLTSVFVHDPLLRVDAPTAQGAGIAGEAVAYRQPPRAFTVTNLGDSTEVVEVGLSADQGTAHLEGAETPFELPPGASRVLAIVHEVATSTGRATQDNLTVAASIHRHPDFSWSASAATQIEDHVAPSLSWKDPPAVWTLDVPLTMKLHAVDAADLKNGTLRATRPDGTVDTITLTPGPDGFWKGQINPQRAGNHTVRAWMTDIHGNTGVSPVTRFEARAIPLPRITFVQPSPGSVVRPGDVVRLIIEQATESTTVLLTGTPLHSGELFQMTLVTEASSANFTLPTMSAGRWQLHAQALNPFGGFADTNINVVVEAPPSVLTEEPSATALEGSTSTPGLSLYATIGAFVALAAIHRRRRG